MPLQDAPQRVQQGLDGKRSIENGEGALGQHRVQPARGLATARLRRAHHDRGWRVLHAAQQLKDAASDLVGAERVGAQIKMAELLDGQAPREGLMQRMLAKMAKIAGVSAANDQMLENEAA